MASIDEICGKDKRGTGSWYTDLFCGKRSWRATKIRTIIDRLGLRRTTTCRVSTYTDNIGERWYTAYLSHLMLDENEELRRLRAYAYSKCLVLAPDQHECQEPKWSNLWSWPNSRSPTITPRMRGRYTRWRNRFAPLSKLSMI